MRRDIVLRDSLMHTDFGQNVTEEQPMSITVNTISDVILKESFV